MKKIKNKLAIACGLISLLVLGIVAYTKIEPTHVVITDKHFYISLLDMEEAYAVEGTYARYMVADFNEDYTLSSIEDYMSNKMGNDGNIYVVSGIFATKNAEDTVYEVAVINESMDSDEDIRYMILDTDTLSVYDLHEETEIFHDEDMIKKLDEYEAVHSNLQEKHMDNYKGHKIISEKYMNKIILDKLNCDEHQYIGIIEKDGVIYHQITIEEGNKTRTILMNARTGDIID